MENQHRDAGLRPIERLIQFTHLSGNSRIKTRRKLHKILLTNHREGSHCAYLMHQANFLLKQQTKECELLPSLLQEQIFQ